MIHRTPFFLPWFYPTLVWRQSVQAKELYLTFDDGPVPGPTEFVLDTLDLFGVKATFFCIGENIGKHPEIFKKIVANGHTVANHTFNHINGWKNSADCYRSNVELCRSEIVKYSSEHTGRIFRPPYGRITRKQIEALRDYKVIMWDVLSVDYNKNVKPQACLSNTIKTVRPGSIIVFHDSYKAEKNMSFTLPRLIEHCIESGYIFKTIPE